MKRLPGVMSLWMFLWLWSACAVAAQEQYVEVSVTAEVPVTAAWNYLQDFSAAHNYVPNLSRTEIVSQELSGVGAHRRVYDFDEGYLEESIISWREGQGFTIKLHDGDAPMSPFERAEFSYRLSAISGPYTFITLRMTIEMPMGSVGAKLAQWFILPVMEENLVQVAAGMKYYYETGLPATDEIREKQAKTVTISPRP
ncbi:MAG: SRPBCC family protein [Halioglobus sp.]